jgi:peptidoglycan hydrolase-like protein with peptidoglycan-binding domain
MYATNRTIRRSTVTVALLTLATLISACGYGQNLAGHSPAAAPTSAAAASQRPPADLSRPDLRHQCPSFRSGDDGPCVDELNRLLILRGFHLPATGRFGPKTSRAIGQFQAGRGLTPNGLVDLATRRALYDDLLNTDSAACDRQRQGPRPLKCP